jgi:hypothetical protein
MQRNLAMIINIFDVITRDKNIIYCFDTLCSGWLDNGPTNIVTPMLLWIILHLKELQHAFHAFIFKHGFSLSE